MEQKFALITFLDGNESPAYPSQGLPGAPAHPGNALPPPGSIATLPVFPFDPTVPDQGLPGQPPLPDQGPIRPGKKFVVKWLACHGLILVPDQGLPTPPPNVPTPLPTPPTPTPQPGVIG